LDVALYCTFYGEMIRVELARKLNRVLMDAGNRRVHVVAHSLGTAVVHDTFDKFYKVLGPGEVGGDYPYLRAGAHNLKTLWTFANVSNLVNVLNNVAEDGETVVKSGPTGCTDALYNVYHTLDPFTWFYPYNADNVEIESGRHFENKVVRKLNTHSFQEYIMDPEVAKYMLAEFIQAVEPLKPQNYEAYMALHKKDAPQGIYEKIESKVQSIKSGAVTKPVTTLKDLLENLREFKEAVEAIWANEEGSSSGGATE